MSHFPIGWENQGRGANKAAKTHKSKDHLSEDYQRHWKGSSSFKIKNGKQKLKTKKCQNQTSFSRGKRAMEEKYVTGKVKEGRWKRGKETRINSLRMDGAKVYREALRRKLKHDKRVCGDTEEGGKDERELKGKRFLLQSWKVQAINPSLLTLKAGEP